MKSKLSNQMFACLMEGNKSSTTVSLKASEMISI